MLMKPVVFLTWSEFGVFNNSIWDHTFAFNFNNAVAPHLHSYFQFDVSLEMHFYPLIMVIGVSQIFLK
jgi:hypothetical protein